MDLLRPSVDIADLTRQADKAREEEARKQQEAKKAAAARKDDRGSLNLEQALLIALLVLVATFALFGLGSVVADKYEQAARFEVAAGSGGSTPQAAEVPPAGTLVVLVKDTAGNPVEGARVSGPYWDEKTTGPDGRVMWEGLSPGTYQADAWTATLGPGGWQSLTLPATQGLLHVITLSPTGGTLTVRVKDGGGNPVPGASVGFVGWPYLPDRTTDASGIVEFPDVQFYEYWLRVNGGPYTVFTFDASHMVLDLTL
jgi:hypothetical protein